MLDSARFYFDFASYGKILRLARRERNARNRRKLLVTLLVWVPLVASFHAICFALDPILFPSLRRAVVRAPVLIVGHARSGTTLLHRLLSGEPSERTKPACFPYALAKFSPFQEHV